MLGWLVVVIGVLLGSVLLFRPQRLGLPQSFYGSTFLGFLILTLGLTAPLITRPEQMMLDSGAETDAFIGAWNLWWTGEAITSGQNPYFTDMLFAPEGTDLSLHTHAVTYGVLTLPLLRVFGTGGPPGLFGVYNLVLLLSFTLSAYLAYRLALTVTGHRGGALLAGIVFAYSNFRFANTVRLHVVAMEWLVLVVWAWIAFWRRPSPLRLVGVAGAAVLLVNASLELSAYAAVVLVGWTLTEVGGRFAPRRARKPAKRRGKPEATPGAPARARRPTKSSAASGESAAAKSSAASGGSAAAKSSAASGGSAAAKSSAASGESAAAKSSAASGGSAGVTASPAGWALGAVGALLVLVLGAAPLAVRLVPRLGDRPAFDPRLAAHFSADLVDFFLPNPRHPLWGAPFAKVTGGFHLGDDGFGQSLGIVAIALFVFACLEMFRAHQGRRWALGTIAGLVLALGPVLQAGGHEVVGLPMPQKLLASLVPILGQSRTPIRWIAPASLCLSVSIAWGWALWRSRASRHGRAQLGSAEGAGAVQARADGAAAVGAGAVQARADGAAAVGAGAVQAGADGATVIAAALLILASLAAPMAFVDEPIPAIYHQIADESRAAGLERATLLHLPGMIPRQSLLYQTVHGQRLIEDVSPAIPLHSAELSALLDPRYAIFVRELARPGALASLGEPGMTRATADLRAYLAANEIRWVVVPSDRAFQEWALGSSSPATLYGRPLSDAYRENLRLLRPIEELEMQGFTAFHF